MVASLVLDRQVEALSENALATIMQEKHNYSDAFTQFVEAVFEEFDFDAALELA